MQTKPFYRHIGKRLLDLVLAGGGVVVISPLVGIIATAIRIESKGPVFFRQQRVGLNGDTFEMLKFRSMLQLEDSYDSQGKPLQNYDRVTKVGKILRSTSIDELPQLVNVIKGEMSLVGPRPTLTYQAERYTERQRGRLDVRPGLTGWAQVNGRNSLTWEEKIEYDLKYVHDLSLKFDLSIIARTFKALLDQKSVSFEKHDALSQHDNDYRSDI